MESKILRPAWWLLFVLLIGMLGLVLLESRDGASSSAHELIDGVIVVGFFGALLGWVHINLPALEQRELKHASLSEFHVVEYEATRSTSLAKQPTESRFLIDDGNPLSLTETKTD